MIRWTLLALLLVAGCKPKPECAEDEPCPFGETCIAGFCEEVSCATSAQCPIENYCDSTRSCVEGCQENSDCMPGDVCDKESNTCVAAECENTSVDCGYKEFCNSATGDCYEAGGDFCKPCEPDANDCGSGNICWAGFCGVNCEGGRECPSGFECSPFTDDVGNIVTYQCITYCWLFEGYAPGTFVSPPGDLKGPFVLEDRLIRLGTALVAMALLAGCPQDPHDSDTDTGNTVVYEGPVLTHTPAATLEPGADVPVSVVATDNDGVGGVRVYYRTTGDAAWELVELVQGTDDTWAGTIPGAAVHAPGLQYYFRGQDLSDLQIATYLPEEGQGTPFDIAIALTGAPIPYTEDFEGLAVAGSTIYGLGWDESAQGFGGYPWAGSSNHAASGTWAVGHKRGVDGIAALDDWLISPPLDLTALPEIQVTWEEYGNQSALAQHSLWISTGSPDPAANEFVKITDLAAPLEDAFDRSAVIDLTAYNTQALAYLAWRYEGQFADDWTIDDVAVEALGPDIRLDDWSAPQVDPGGSIEVTFTIGNASPKDSGPFTVSASTDVANGVFSDVDEEGLVDALAANTTVDVHLDLTVDAAFLDDSMLPFTLTIDQDGEQRTWDLELVVGTLPTATIDVSATAQGLVQGWLGVGDPDDPELEFAAFSEIINGTHGFDVDLAAQTANLPPVPGPGRWYLRLSAAAAGSVTGFSVAYDDTVYEGDDLGAWVAGGERIYFLPRPPKPAVAAWTTTPETLAPGDDGVVWSVTLENQGAATVGLTTALVTTDDPNVTVLTTTPTQLSASGWAANALTPFDVSFDVSDAKIDSQPIRFTVTVTDEVETFTTEATVEVPWPVLHVTGVSFDDPSPADNDGLLDPAERADIVVELTNQGGKQAGGVDCVLSRTGGTATANILDATGSYGLLTVGETDETAFDVQITGGGVGSTLDLSLDCTDSLDHPYSSTFQVVLGETPWVTLSALDDPLGDASSGDIDLINGRYRSDGTTLELVLESGTAFNPATLFFESWMIQQGSEFVLYQLVVQGHATGAPTATVRGCTLYLSGNCYSFGTVTTPTAAVLSSTEVHVAVDLADMGLVVDRLDAGFGGGFCGGEDLYCDSLPDSWGNGVTGVLTFRLLPLDVGATTD